MSHGLLLSSTVALVLLIVHSWRTRGRTVTVAFFVSGFLFGVIRGNVVWLTGWLLYGAGARVPYTIAEGLIPPIGHESVQAAVGWVFALYLAWTVSELILRRIGGKGDGPPSREKGSGPFSSRVFMIAGLSALFMPAICYCMETAAVAAGWWYWSLSTKSALFGRTNIAAMESWFSLAPCFLIPFLVIVCSEARGRLRWLSLAVYPMYALGHLVYAVTPWGYPLYNALELLVVALMMFHPLRMARGEIDPRADKGLTGQKIGPGPIFLPREIEKQRWRPRQWGFLDPENGTWSHFSLLPGAALAIFFAMLVVSNLASGAGMDSQMTLLPMLMLCLLAWRRAPVVSVAALSVAGVAGWAWAGPRALWALVPVTVFAFLKILERKGEALWLKLVPIALTGVLAAAATALHCADIVRRETYYRAWVREDALESLGRADEAAAAWEEVVRSRPRDPMRLYVTVLSMAWADERDPQGEALALEQRLPHIVAELEEVARRDPWWVEPRQDLADYYLLQGRLADVIAEYREMCALRPTDPRMQAMLGYFLLRAGAADAEAACERARRLPHPPAAATINLGTIRFGEGRDAEARMLWREALKREPKHPIALMNIERPAAPAHREIDIRYLAQVPGDAKLAGQLNRLAARGKGYSPAERLRLVIEASLAQADWIVPQLNLADLYSREGPQRDLDRALWHARRAVAIAREFPWRTDLPDSLLALGRVLILNGKPDEALSALEEGRSKAPAAMLPAFDALISALTPPRP